jgi:diguanylate cyclase (GGDEF)-like protein
MAFTLPMITQQDRLQADRRVRPQEVAEKKRAEDWTRSIHTEAEYSGADVIREVSEDDLPGEISPTNGPRLLLVEDNPDMLNFLVFQLKGEYSLITARDGEDGVQKAMAHLPDLVVSDVMMPVKDGYQLCKEIKADSRTCHIPVILLTAKADLSMKIEGLQYGADDYLTKPFSSEELQARIKSLLNLRKLEKELQIKNQELQRQAITDSLTGLYNHQEFQKRLLEAMEMARRHGGEFSLLMLDVDHFKAFNDLYGHPIGDTLLKGIVRIIQNCIRNVDIPARYGGEEFSLILPETTGDGAKIVAERIRRSIHENPFSLSSGKFTKISVSIGIASFPHDGGSCETLIAAADQALYLAKAEGRNRVCRFSDCKNRYSRI